MLVAYVVVSLAAAALVAMTGGLKLARHPSMARNAAHLGYSDSTFRRVGLLEVAAAVSLIAGLWWTPLGLAAAAGLVLLMSGAALAHARVHDPMPASAPAALCGLLALTVCVLGTLR